VGGSPVGERTFVTISLAIIVRPPSKATIGICWSRCYGAKRLGVEGGEGVKVVAGAEL
jgi:hypothetical protein